MKATQTSEKTSRTHLLWICAFLILSTLWVYWPVTAHQFVNFDDTDYVTTNTVVQAGLAKESVIWAFRHDVARNWHPVTLMSHMLDCQMYGLKPGGHHFTNLLFHIANTLLLFFVLRRLSGALWRSAAVAALFALHPLHVESVAWVAERKDVLSAFFWLLTIWAYHKYVLEGRTVTQAPAATLKGAAKGISKIPPTAAQTSSRTRKNITFYILALLFAALGLMSKPMVVTLPCTLLLLDLWPLKRVSLSPFRSAVPLSRLLFEKIPFFAMSAAVCWVTFRVQQSGGAVLSTAHLPLGARAGNALISYTRYLGKMVWPDNLAGLYLKNGEWPMELVIGAAILLLAISLAVLLLGRRREYLIAGWCWYLGTLVPVIGLVQVGMQSMADRYTYVPLIGVFIMLAWGGWELASRGRVPRMGLRLAVAAVLVACLALTRMQLAHWQNSETLFQRMIAVSDKNFIAHFNLGNYYSREDQLDKAIAHYKAAVEAEPNYANAHNNLGGALLKQRRFDEAIEHYAKAAQINPEPTQYFNLANAYADAGRVDEAVKYYWETLKLDPNYFDAHKNMGSVLIAHGRNEEAIAVYRSTLQLNPSLEFAEVGLGNCLANLSRLDDAIGHYSAALRLDPNHAETYNGLGICYAMQGKLAEAAQQFENALKLHPDDAGAHSNLGNALASLGKIDDAIPHYLAALQANPKDYQAHFNLGLSLARQHKIAEAENHYREALRLNPAYTEAQKALASLKQEN